VRPTVAIDVDKLSHDILAQFPQAAGNHHFHDEELKEASQSLSKLSKQRRAPTFLFGCGMEELLDS
jgi:hypothetical protein